MGDGVAVARSRRARRWRAALGLLGVALALVALAPGGDARARAQGAPQGQAATVTRVVIPLPFAFPPTVNAYIVRRGDAAAIVDTGIPGSADALEAALVSAGLEWTAVRQVILTHNHPDHTSGAPEVLARAYLAQLWIGAADIPLLRSAAARPAYDGDEIFGLRVVATPGHTGGHISLFDPGTGTLLAGDAIWNLGGTLTGSAPQFTWSGELAAASVRRLGTLTFERAYMGHGEPLESGAAQAIRQLGAREP